MNKAWRLLSIGLAIVLVTVVLPPASEAATLTTLNVTLTAAAGTCAGSAFQINFGWAAVVGDLVDGNDGVGMIAYDGNGVSIAADWNGWLVGTTSTETTPFGGGAGINAITARPITIQVFDIAGAFPPFGQNTQAIYDDIAARGAPLMATLVYDPANDAPACASLPYVGAAGCEAYLNLSATSVVGAFVADASVYSEPGVLTEPVITIPAGKTYWVLGLDATGQYYKIYLQCQAVWVPASTMGPNYDDVWQGAPLPTGVVE